MHSITETFIDIEMHKEHKEGKVRAYFFIFLHSS